MALPGFEMETAAVYRNYLKGFCHNTYTDVMGNTIGIINEDAEFKVMLAGHYDEIGFQVLYISDEGLIYFRSVGGIDRTVIPGIEVEVMTSTGNIPGIIGKKPIHLTTPKERDNLLELKDLWIDIGSDSKEETEKLVSIGDPITFKKNYELFGKNKIKSKSLDDKIGAFIVAETIRNLSNEKNLKVGVYCVGTVQEELGLRGAQTSAFGIDPNVGFAVDVCFTSDTPDVDKKILGDIKVGDGPILTRFADENRVLGRRMRETAKKKDIPYQEEAGRSATGGTDTSRIQLTKNGVATALVSVPSRYMHTPVELCDIRDVENSIKLLTETILSFDPKDTFIPGID